MSFEFNDSSCRRYPFSVHGVYRQNLKYHYNTIAKKQNYSELNNEPSMQISIKYNSNKRKTCSWDGNSRVAAASYPFFVGMSHSQWFERESQKFSHTKKIFFQSDVIWNVRCAKHLHLFYRCPLLLDRSKHFIRHSLLLVRFTLSLYVDQGLQRQHRSFLFVRRCGKQKLKTFLLECVLSLSEHCLPLFVRDNYSKLDPF